MLKPVIYRPRIEDPTDSGSFDGRELCAICNRDNDNGEEVCDKCQEDLEGDW